MIGRAESKSHCEKMFPPVLISRREAKYPDEVRRQRIEGSVVLQGTVSTDGVLGDIKVLESADVRLTDLALDAFRAWRYKPALCAKEPVETYVTTTFSFKLDR
jgi:periplasmic protein TonB